MSEWARGVLFGIMLMWLVAACVAIAAHIHGLPDQPPGPTTSHTILEWR